MGIAQREDTRTLALDRCRIDGGTQARAGLDPVTVDDYAGALAAGAVFPPIVVFYDGSAYWVADGFHRVAAHARAGRSEIEITVKMGTRRDALLYAVGANSAHGLRRTNADKRRAVELLLGDPEWGTWSDREIARRCGVWHTFVADVRSSLEPDTSDTTERTYRDKHGTLTTMHTANIGRASGQPVLTNGSLKTCETCGQHWTADLLQCPYCTKTPEQRIEGLRPSMAVHFSSDSPEHYTPRVIIDLAVACLGTIDLDPCSDGGDPPNVPAARHFTQADDGLSQSWAGTVYMNPPYGREIERWIEKLCQEHERGAVTEAIALVPARTDTQWFIRLRDYVCCFVEGRLTFIGNDDPAPFPSAVFFLGEDIGKFHHYFAALGDIWQKIEPGMYGE